MAFTDLPFDIRCFIADIAIHNLQDKAAIKIQTQYRKEIKNHHRKFCDYMLNTNNFCNVFDCYSIVNTSWRYKSEVGKIRYDTKKFLVGLIFHREEEDPYGGMHSYYLARIIKEVIGDNKQYNGIYKKYQGGEYNTNAGMIHSWVENCTIQQE